LKSGEKGLDKNLYKTLQAQTYPNIVFHLSSYRVGASTESPSAYHVTTQGTLEIAGHSQPVEVQAESSATAGPLQLEGQYPLLMSDYGIKPPTMMMGTVKVKNRVVIHYRLSLVPS